jgi:hypothetical protein
LKQGEAEHQMMILMLAHQERLNAIALAKAEQELREATLKADAAGVLKQILVKQLGESDTDAAIKARKWFT